MAAVSGTIEAPSQGISQASPAIRLTSQASSLEDSLVEIPEGWRKRPPMDYLGLLSGITLSTNAQFDILTDPDDGTLKLLLLNSEAGACVAHLFNYPALTGTSLTVDSNAQTYLSYGAPSPLQDIGILKAVDTNILTNRLKPVTVDATPNATRPHEAIIFVKAGQFGRQYKVTVQKSGGAGITFYWDTPTGEEANDTLFVDTGVIAYGLLTDVPFTINGNDIDYSPGHNKFNQLSGGGPLTSDGFTIVLRDNLIYLSHTTDFTITAVDGAGGENMAVIKDSVALFSDLPRAGFDGFTVKIDPVSKDGSLPTGAYYVKWTGNADTGVWKETFGPGSQKGIDLASMPIAIIKTGGAWHMQRIPWKQRVVGDETLAPDPGFVGTTIKDVGYAFNRLAILYDEGSLQCAADDPFRVYPATLATAIDSDPFETVTPGASRAKFFAIVPFNKTFLYFGQKKQAVLEAPGEGPVTGSNTKLVELTQYTIEDDHKSAPTLLKLRPQFSNRYAYYPTLVGPNYYAIYEIALDRLSGQPLSENLTPHLPRLLPSTIDRAAGVQASYMIVYGATGSNELFVHLFRYAGSGYDYKRVQNGWFHWNIPSGWTLNGLGNVGTVMIYLLRKGSGEAHVAAMETAPLAVDPGVGATIQTLLDLRLTEALVTSVTYDATVDQSTVTLPFNVADTHQMAARAPAGAFPEGYLAQVVSHSTTHLVVKGDWRTQAFYVGYKYTADWGLSTIYYNSTGDQRPLTSGRLRLRRLKAQLFNSSYLKFTCQVGGRPVRSYTLPVDRLGTPPSFSGTWRRVPINGENEAVNLHFLNDSHLPHRLTSIEWVADFDGKTQRVT